MKKPKKEKESKPIDGWEISGICFYCMKHLVSRHQGKEVQHVDGTPYCGERKK